jgi:ATP adenylyltransferase
VVVLNKFAIVPEHLIVVTKAFKEQTHLLEEDDIAATYACIRAYKAQGKELFAFFNSGEDSGASQPHRHIQFLPVESMKEGLDEAGWAPLAEGLLSHPPPGMCFGLCYGVGIEVTQADTLLDLPFQYFAAPLKDDPSPTELYGLYRSLYEQAFRSIDDFTFHHHGKHLVAPSDRTGPSAMSYNMAMTDRVIVLLPRRSEGIVIAPHGQQPDNPEPVALNGTTLAGTLLVKNESEWIALRQDEKKLLELLTAIGVPSSGLSVPATL